MHARMSYRLLFRKCSCAGYGIAGLLWGQQSRFYFTVMRFKPAPAIQQRPVSRTELSNLRLPFSEEDIRMSLSDVLPAEPKHSSGLNAP